MKHPLFTIIPFEPRHAPAVERLCKTIADAYRYENEVFIPFQTLLRRDFEGFIAVSLLGEAVGFVGIVYTSAYAYPFGLRVLPSFERQGLGQVLSDRTIECSFRKRSIVRSAYLSDNKSMQKIITENGWREVDQYLMTKKSSSLRLDTEPMRVSLGTLADLDAVADFIEGEKVGSGPYDAMFPADLVWYPRNDIGVLTELLQCGRVLLSRNIRGALTGVAILSDEAKASNGVIMHRLWGDPGALCASVDRSARPKTVRWCVHASEEAKAESLGFSLARFTDSAGHSFASRYSLIELRR